jgi:predicted ATPase/DNA-binding XRE family transcriptional regulator
VAAASFADLLKQYRASAGLTQEVLAERANLSVRAISDLERGVKQRPYPHTVQRLIQALDLEEGDAEHLRASARRPEAGGDGPAGQTDGRSALPIQPTSFIGREREVEEIETILCREDVRLLTLTGPGGVGKTRLALRVAESLVDHFPDGVVFVSLASLTDPGLIPSTIAASLRVTEVGDQSVLETLTTHLHDQQLLLVLDNFEHLLPAADVVSRLLASCARLTVLVTSRAALHLAAEHEWPVPPLPVPVSGHLPDLDTLGRYDAVQLFVQRAQAVEPAFEVCEENAATVAEICSRLDGLPLALELGAARLRLFPPEALLGRLSDRLQLLTGGPRDVAARQQTLRNTIEWSYRLLAPEEQILFARLSVFANGGSLEAAEAICATESDDAMLMLDGLTSLVDQHLLRQTGDDEPRFGMLEIIHEYAAERLGATAEAQAVRRRHATYYLHMAEEAAEGIAGPDQGLWLDRLETDHDNVRSALSWFLEQGELDAAYRMVLGAEALWVDRHLMSEASQWYSQLLSQEGAVSTHLRATVLRRASSFLRRQARALLAESIALFRELQDKRGEARSLADLAHLAADEGELTSAANLAEASLSLAREVRDQWGIAYACQTLGVIWLAQCSLEEAETMLAESVDLFRQVGSPGTTAWAIHWLTWVAFFQGAYERAAVLGEEALSLEESIGNVFGAGMMRRVLALAALERGEVERAANYARRIDSAVDSMRVKLHTVDALAAVAVARGDACRAARLWGVGASWGDSRSRYLPLLAEYYARYQAEGRAQVGEEAWAHAWEEGWAMTLEHALEYALEGVAPPRSEPTFRTQR